MLRENRRAPPAPLQLSRALPSPGVMSPRWAPPPTPPPKSPLPTPPVSPATPGHVSSFHRHSFHRSLNSPLLDMSTARRPAVTLCSPVSPTATVYSKQLPDTPMEPVYLERQCSTTYRKRSRRRKPLPKWSELPTKFLEDDECDETLASVHPFARSAGPDLEAELDDSDTVPASPTSYLSPLSPTSSYYSAPLASTSSMYGADTSTSTSSLTRPVTPCYLGTYPSSAHIDERIADLESQLQMLRIHLAQSSQAPRPDHVRFHQQPLQPERAEPPARIRGVRSIPILRSFTKLGRSSKG